MRFASRVSLLVLPLCWQLIATVAQAQPAATGDARASPPPAAFDAKAYRESNKLARQRERDASNAARPSYYRRRRGLGFAAIGVGAGLAFTGLGHALLYAVLTIAPHNEDGSAMSPSDRRLIGATLGIGLPVLAVGIWAVRSPVVEARNRRLSVAPYLRLQAGTQLGLVAKLSL